MKYQILLMRTINPQRKKFCRLLAGGESGAGAYRKAYKNKNSTTCKTNAYRLMQQSNVLVYLTIIQKGQPTAAQQQAPPTKVKVASPACKPAQPAKASTPGPSPFQAAYPNVSTKQEAETLTTLMRQEARMGKYKVVNGQWTLVPMPIKPRQIIKCIRQLNKMDKAYPPRKIRRKKKVILVIIRRLQPK